MRPRTGFVVSLATLAALAAVAGAMELGYVIGRGRASKEAAPVVDPAAALGEALDVEAVRALEGTRDALATRIRLRDGAIEDLGREVEERMAADDLTAARAANVARMRAIEERVELTERRFEIEAEIRRRGRP